MYSSYSSNFLSLVITLCGALLYLSYIGAQILFACAAYHDAKSLNNKDATMWAVLIGLLGLIPEIIYLCVRKNNRQAPVQQVCIACRAPLYPGTAACPYCGSQQPPVNAYLTMGYLPPEQCAIYHARAKKLLIAGIVCIALFILTVIGASVAIAVGSSGHRYHSSYY